MQVSTGPIHVFSPYWSLWITMDDKTFFTLCMLGKKFSRRHFENIFHIFPRKLDKILHANCLQMTFWNIFHIFPRKLDKTLHANCLLRNLHEVSGPIFLGNIRKIQSTLIISNSKGLSKILWDIRTSTYQICRLEEKINRTTAFNKYIRNWTLAVRDMLKILWKRGAIFPLFHNILLLDFHV